MMVSKSGGMEIEEVAAKDPKAIVREVLDPGLGMFPFQARKLAFALGLSGESFKKGVAFMPALFEGLRRDGRLARRDQSAPRHEGGATSSRSTPR